MEGIKPYQHYITSCVLLMWNISEFLVKRTQAASVCTVSLGVVRIDYVEGFSNMVIVKLNVTCHHHLWYSAM